MPMMDPSLTAYSAMKDDDYDSGYLGLDDSQELMKKLGINQVKFLSLAIISIVYMRMFESFTFGKDLYLYVCQITFLEHRKQALN